MAIVFIMTYVLSKRVADTLAGERLNRRHVSDSSIDSVICDCVFNDDKIISKYRLGIRWRHRSRIFFSRSKSADPIYALVCIDGFPTNRAMRAVSSYRTMIQQKINSIPGVGSRCEISSESEMKKWFFFLNGDFFDWPAFTPIRSAENPYDASLDSSVGHNWIGKCVSLKINVFSFDKEQPQEVISDRLIRNQK